MQNIWSVRQRIKAQGIHLVSHLRKMGRRFRLWKWDCFRRSHLEPYLSTWPVSFQPYLTIWRGMCTTSPRRLVTVRCVNLHSTLPLSLNEVIEDDRPIRDWRSCCVSFPGVEAQRVPQDKKLIFIGAPLLDVQIIDHSGDGPVKSAYFPLCPDDELKIGTLFSALQKQHQQQFLGRVHCINFQGHHQ